MLVCRLVCAVLTRVLFLLFSLTAVWRVVRVKREPRFWLLLVLDVPLLLENLITLKKRRGTQHTWFSPVILFFLISIIPPIWILELHHQENKTSDPQCQKLDSWNNVQIMIQSFNTTLKNQTLQDIEHLLSSVCPNDWILALHQTLLILLIIGRWLLPLGGGVTRDELSELLLIFVGTAADILEFTNETLSDVKDKSVHLVYVILAVWTWSMLQFPLHLAVVTPRSAGDSREQVEQQVKQGEEGGCCRDAVLGHRADVWKVEEVKQVKVQVEQQVKQVEESGCCRDAVLGHRADVWKVEKLVEVEMKQVKQVEVEVVKKVEEGEEGGCCRAAVLGHSADVWKVLEALLVQDGPFLLIRIIIITRFQVFHQMLIFFSIKNFLVLILNLYRLTVICVDIRSSSSSSSSSSKHTSHTS